jgi:DNA-binding response OmpR family regulator
MAAAPEPETARILIVDDHEDNVELLRARLESWGYETESAADGEEALMKVDASPPDLILLDVMMPKIDGIEVARRVKGNSNLPFIPIIMQTALDATENKVEGLEAGADDYITKPIDFAELKARLNSMLRIKSTRCSASSASRRSSRSANGSCSRRTNVCDICHGQTPSPDSIIDATSRNGSRRCSSMPSA